MCETALKESGCKTTTVEIKTEHTKLHGLTHLIAKKRKNRLHKIFNKNALTLSYRWMSNMSSVIKQLHFKKNRSRDCRFMAAVLLMVNVYKHIICKADIIINKDSHIYSDGSDGKFKSR